MVQNRELTIETVSRWDNEALTLLYQHFYQALTHLAYSILGDEELARDNVQEVFSALWQKRIPFESIPLLKAYLYNSVRNHCIDYLRKQHLSTNRLSDLERHYGEFSLSDEGEEQFYEEEVYRQLFQAIDCLPAKQREIFLLAMEGKRLREIADVLQLSINTVKTQKRRGLKTLREQLGENKWAVLSPLFLPITSCL